MLTRVMEGKTSLTHQVPRQVLTSTENDTDYLNPQVNISLFKARLDSCHDDESTYLKAVSVTDSNNSNMTSSKRFKKVRQKEKKSNIQRKNLTKNKGKKRPNLIIYNLPLALLVFLYQYMEGESRRSFLLACC